MKKIHYETISKDSAIIKTACQIEPQTKVGSLGCQACIHNEKTNKKARTVYCTHPEVK